MNDNFRKPSVGTWKIYSYLGSHVDVGRKTQVIYDQLVINSLHEFFNYIASNSKERRSKLLTRHSDGKINY